jgi:hypothetical protein
MSQLKINALRARYEAQKLEALATIDVYMNNAVGVGEHPGIIDILDEQLRKVEEANSLISLVDNLFSTVKPVVEETKKS